MQYDQFVKKVQTAAQLNSKQEAEQAIKVVLETTAERIVGNEASQLAAQLPQELGQYLRGHEGENGDHFPISEFYSRICNRAGVEPEAAASQAIAVFTVLSEAVTPGEFSDVRSNFSEDYAELFATPAK